MQERLNKRCKEAGIRVVVRQSARARRISISVRRSGEVTLTTPVGGDSDMALRFLESKMEWVIAAVERQRSKPQSPTLSVEELNRYITMANSYLPERIEYISKEIGLKYNNLSITRARTRWGSCSTRNDISLSFHLMRLPKHLIDFVIIHELCHTVHHNHSTAFHVLVNIHTNGKESQLEREMKEYKM